MEIKRFPKFSQFQQQAEGELCSFWKGKSLIAKLDDAADPLYIKTNLAINKFFSNLNGISNFHIKKFYFIDFNLVNFNWRLIWK